MKLLYAVAKALRCEPPCCGRPGSDSVRKPDAGKLHVRFDERDLETERFALPRQISTLLKNAPGGPKAQLWPLPERLFGVSPRSLAGKQFAFRPVRYSAAPNQLSEPVRRRRILRGGCRHAISGPTRQRRSVALESTN